MSQGQKDEGCLAPYRVLDLTRGGYQLCGRILGDLGADVIKVEPTGGDSSRRIGPFYHDIPDPEKSLFWFAYNANKRGITLDIEKQEDRQIFLRLARTADFVIESFPPGYMDKLGLGYSDLGAINPRLIMTSITPFGQKGPYAHYRASDLITWAMSGLMYLCGDADRAPTWVSWPQASFQAASDGAAASMIAHWYREETGIGQHVDVSTQESASNFLWDATLYWDLTRFNMPRTGNAQVAGKTVRPIGYRCKDGYVNVMVGGGGAAGIVESSKALVAWMAEENMAPEWLKTLDWAVSFDTMHITQEIANPVTEAIVRFIATKSKTEILEQAVRRGIIAAPVCTSEDICKSPQFKTRKFWTRVKHPELDDTLTYCGPFAKLTETPIKIRRRAPLTGEHNREILEGEEGLSIPALSVKKEIPAKERGKALEGLKVVDFGVYGVNPMTTRYLADHGATVIRVESHTRLDNRMARPFKDNIPGLDRAGAFTFLNSSKYGLTLNLTREKGREIGLRLVKWADVISEGLAPGIMKRLGLGYESARKVKPDIIYFSTCMLGQYGPYAALKGFGHQAAALAGLYELTGWPDRGPGGLFGAYTDWISPRFAVAAIIAALDYRRRTGKGQYIDQSQVETGMHFIAPVIMDYLINGHVKSRNGNRLSCAAPHGVYPCKGEDQWIAIEVFTEEEWQALCKVTGMSELAENSQFACLKGRKEAEDLLDKLISQWTINFTPEEIMTRFQAAGVPAGVMNDVRAIFQDPQLTYRGHFRYLEHPVMGVHAYNAVAFRLSKTPDCQRPSPLLGQHNEYVFKELLGLTDDEIADLLVEGAITTDADLPEYFTKVKSA